MKKRGALAAAALAATLTTPLATARVTAPSGSTFPVIVPAYGGSATKREVHEDLGELLTVEEAAEELRIAVVTIRMWIAKRRIGHVRIGRRIRIPRSEATRLIESNYVPPRPERHR